MSKESATPFKRDPMPDVLIAGEILVEIMADKIGQRFDTTGIFHGPFASGAPAIFIDQVARMGVSSSIVGCVGEDGFGRLVVNRLAHDGVDISNIKVVDHLPTGTAFVTYNADGSREFIFNIGNSAAGVLDSDMIHEQLFTNCKFFHVMGSFLSTERSRQIIRKAIGMAQKVGARITFDPNVRPELMAAPGTKDAIMEVLGFCDVFLPSEIDLVYMFGEKEEQQHVADLLEKYPMSMVAVKKAQKGATFYDRERSIQTPAFKVVEVDPTGAGDCFCGAFVACLASGIGIELAMELSCAAGALAVAERGPMEGAVTLSELKAFIRSAERYY